MKYTKNDILKELREGVNVDTIASAFTDNLNAALEEYKAETAETEKKAEFAAIYQQFVWWVKKYYPNEFADLSATINDKEAAKAYEIFVSTIDLSSNINTITKTITENDDLFNTIDKIMNHNTNPKPKTNSFADLVSSFLDS